MAGKTDKDKAALPWSVKGVTPEARDLAKQAAAQEGLTMGEWLSRVIRTVGDEGADEDVDSRGAGPGTDASPRSSGDHRHPPGADGAVTSLPAAAAEATAASVVDHVRTMERRVLDVVGPLQEIVDHLAVRLERLERSTRRSDDRG